MHALIFESVTYNKFNSDIPPQFEIRPSIKYSLNCPGALRIPEFLSQHENGGWVC
jgi:hypothetical protein